MNLIFDKNIFGRITEHELAWKDGSGLKGYGSQPKKAKSSIHRA